MRTIVRLGSGTRVLGDRERATGFLHVERVSSGQTTARFGLTSEQAKGTNKNFFTTQNYLTAYAYTIVTIFTIH